ncbi:ComEA family DNA-binding protein [Yersinia aldovae]|uniref:Competence protein ComEA n=1 Tax=Yersinia aldovae TaxID=29483 RepID=A0A0T9UHJ7_YERAL|nr:helix-hairpin-helix domain-containing protein [Yersinia aldovae]EEP95094.1 Competence protein ComEA helix-hairpin-helix repeat protein [Yersinia aldovae ATCC 35236]CNJ05212.1 competence protein ComEA [Yersinia aldovae]CNL42696.1 competence protein ComEA [Yersinia aldovae]CNL49448.1 competence protein ComEA [Yersinia aldovae]
MKFIGKLFVITTLLASLNIHQAVSAAPVSADSRSQEKVLSQPLSSATDNISKKSAKVAEGKSENPKTIAAHPTENQTNQINVNSASAEQLAQFLSGIGRKKAEAIVNYREQFGPFSDAEQLLEIPGIGPSFLERNSNKLKM